MGVRQVVSDSAEGPERRRAERVPGSFLVMVQGVDEDLVLRHGDISPCGVIFGADGLGLEVGSLEYLHLMAPDRSAGLVVMAQVARLVSLSGGSEGGPKEAVAFELLVRDPAQQVALQTLVEHLDRRAAAAALEPASAGIFTLNVVRMELEATWPVEVGEKVQLVMNSFGGQTRIPFEGVVRGVRVEPRPEGPPRFTAEVRMLGAGLRAARPHHPSITQSIDLVMNDLMTVVNTADLTADRTHLKGRLDRIPLTGLLSWFHMERMSGRLGLDGPAGAATLFLRDGDLVDVDPCGDRSPRQMVARALAWDRGRFTFAQGAVQREDRIGTPLHALLMDLAREADEASHRGALRAV